MYKHSHAKRLAKKMSKRAINGWKTRRLIMQAEPRVKTVDEIFEQTIRERKGKHFDTWTKGNLTSIDIFHSKDGRSDQFDIVIWLYREGGQIKTTETKISKPKLLKLWSEL